MITGPAAFTIPKNSFVWMLGDIKLDECSEYTHLGEVISQDMSLTKHIIHLHAKAYSILNTIFATATEPALNMMKMATLIELYETCWLRAVLYNAETWGTFGINNPKLEQLQLNALRRILKIPSSTPKAAIYGDLGILPISHEVHKLQFLYLWRVLNSETITKKVINNQIKHKDPNSWLTNVTNLLTHYKLPTNLASIQSSPLPAWKKIITNRIDALFTEWYTNETTKLTKMLMLSAYKCIPKKEQYITNLSRNEASAIFRLRFKMTLSPLNHSSGSPVCPRCKDGLASDQHALTSCIALQHLRDKYNIYGITAVFTQSEDSSLMKKYAAFLVEAKLIPSEFASFAHPPQNATRKTK